jgi:hypothetical protein
MSEVLRHGGLQRRHEHGLGITTWRRPVADPAGRSQPWPRTLLAVLLGTALGGGGVTLLALGDRPNGAAFMLLGAAIGLLGLLLRRRD